MSRLLLVVALLVAAPSAHGQVVRGRVVDEATGAPIHGALVRLADESGSGPSVLSDERGAFTATAPAGVYTLSAERIGYAPASFGPLRLRPGGFVEITLPLAAEALPIDTVAVSVAPRNRALESSGFYQRRDRGGGHFIDRAGIEATKARTLTRLVERTPGMRIESDRFGNATKDVPPTGSGSGLGTFVAQCRPPVYINGTLAARSGRAFGAFDLEAVLADQIEAMEIYTGPGTTPAQFSADTSCGVIVIWTRR